MRHSPRWADHSRKPPYGSVEIDWAHPLSRGLVFYLLYNEGSGQPILRTPAGNVAARPDGGDATSFLWHPNGTVQPTSAWGQTVTWNPPNHPTLIPRPMTCAGEGTFCTNGDVSSFLQYLGPVGHYLFGFSHQYGYYAFRVWMRSQSYEELDCYFDRFQGAYLDSAVWPLGEYRTVAITLDSPWTTGSTWRGYLNGKFGQSFAPPTSWTSDYTGTSAKVIPPTAASGARIKWTALWFREFSALEVAWLHAEPYCFLKERIRRTYGFLSAALSNFLMGPFPMFRPDRPSG